MKRIGINFYSHAPCGARPGQNSWKCRLDHFYSHASCEARHISICDIFIEIVISTHTPRAGRDKGGFARRFGTRAFLLTRPMRGATNCNFRSFLRRRISTHTPHAGRDWILPGNQTIRRTISTHTPHAGRDWISLQKMPQDIPFLLTRPMRGATFLEGTMSPLFLNFYSHAPCGARRWQAVFGFVDDDISTHTPHAGRDIDAGFNPNVTAQFLLTRPMRGATRRTVNGMKQHKDFYSHAPCGARRFDVVNPACSKLISTHTPRAGRDMLLFLVWMFLIKFLLTRPVRGATDTFLRPVW